MVKNKTKEAEGKKRQSSDRIRLFSEFSGCFSSRLGRGGGGQRQQPGGGETEALEGDSTLGGAVDSSLGWGTIALGGETEA